SLSPPVRIRQRPPRLQTAPPATTLGADLRDRSQMNHDTTANNPRPSAAAAVAGIGRKKPWKPTVRHELPAARSPPFLNQISRVRHQEPDRIVKETFEGRSSSDHLGDSAEFSAEV
ncbi:hypothetical protein Prudu_003649, partial [Prunus dulcis]